MSKDIADRKKVTALTRVSILLILTFLFSPSFSENLLKCPDFEQPDSLSQCWTHLSWGSNNIIAKILPFGYNKTNCLMMWNNDPCLLCEYTKQMIGSLEPGIYGLSVLYKTLPECQAKLYIMNTSQNEISKGAIKNGTGNWDNLNLKFAVMEEHADQIWQVLLYGGLPPNIAAPIYYDNAVLEKLDITQIEEIDLRYWIKRRYRFTDGFPDLNWTPDKTSICDASLDPHIRGQFALVLKGSRTTVDSYSFTIPVKPQTKYKVCVSLKYKNRKCYNYLESDIPYPSDCLDPNSYILKYTKGIWSGQYGIKVYDDDLGGSYRADLVQPATKDWVYSADTNRGWFSEKSFYQTGPNAKNLTTQIELTCFDGDLYVDELAVEEVNTHIEDAMLRIPIEYEYEGMKFVSSSLPSIKTNAAEFLFNDNSIWLIKGSSVLGLMMFDNNFLSSLTVDTTVKGLVILKNSNISLSLGADSSMIVRLEKDTKVTVNGIKPPKYYNFDAGVLFVSDFEKGFLFAPVFPDLNIQKMGGLMQSPYANYDPNIVDFNYNDSDMNFIGLKCWDSQPDFTNSFWKITYNFKQGDGFAASVFPPKDFNYIKYAKERMHSVSFLNLNIYPQGDYRYLLSKFRERFNILLLWMGSYNLSSPDKDAPTVYYTDSYDNPVRPDAPHASAVKFVHHDVAGPFNVSQPDALKRLVSQAHKMGLKVIVYMAPFNFYTSDINALLDNLNNNIAYYDIDGVYFDGLYQCKPLRSLELVRKARAALKDKYYVQHNSWTNTLIYQSDHFRVPFYDAYADLIYAGENIRKDLSGNPKTWTLDCPADPNVWGLLYCNKNLSNTPTTLIGTYRPVDYSDINTGPDLTLSPRAQMDYQLKYHGIFRVWPLTSSFYFGDLTYKKKLFVDSGYWWNIFDNLCLNYSVNDGSADIGESIYTAPRDCAPPKTNAVLIKQGNTYEYIANDSLSQWLIDGKPLYRFHYNFDGDIATEDSDNKMNPNHFLDLLPSADSNYIKPDSNYIAPFSSRIDGRKTFYFNGSARLFGEHNVQLRFMDDSNNITSFSSFAIVRRDTDSDQRQYIFNLNSNSHHFSYGFYKNKFFIRVRDSENKSQEYSSAYDIDQNWHTVGLAYGGTNLTMYIDGAIVKVIPAKLAPFPAIDTFVIGSSGIGLPGFKGWIDDLFVTDRLLTAQQILEYHNNAGKSLTVTNASKVDCILIQNGQKYTAAGTITWTYCIKDGSGQAKAGFDSYGNLLLKGAIKQNALPVAGSGDEFRVQSFDGSDVAIIDSMTGNMYIKGSVFQKQAVLSPSGSFNFIICDNKSNVVAHIDESGNLYLSGKLYDKVDI